MAINVEENWKDLTPYQLTQLKEEIRISRDILAKPYKFSRIPHLPSFSGDGGIDFVHFLSAVENVSQINS